jgi:outer membrane receptor protein involved in Fe transport
MLASAATATVMAASSAWAQAPALPTTTAADDTAVDTVVVTGTRLQASGFTTPTPVTVLGSQTINNRGKLNIAEALNELPSFQPSSGPSQATRNITGTLGFSTLDLRGLGASRTLVLVDGRRFVPIAPNGVVDAAVIPTSLVERVETVTGGASAAYGSDAVAGVVNFILRDRLDGFRANVQTSTSQHGGAQEWAANGAIGKSFMDGRLHVIAGVDWVKNLGLSSQYKRDWGAEEPGYAALSANRPAGVPANVLGTGHHFSNMTPGGIINSGPLAGTAFAPGGIPYRFQYGALSGPSFMLGGENYGLSDSSVRRLVNPTERVATLARINFDLTPNTTLYSEFSYARGQVSTQGAFGRTPNALTININNPYLPAATRAAMQAAGVTTFNMGRYTMENGPGRNLSTNNVYRGVLGAKGKIFDNWQWDAYVETGKTLTRSDYYNMVKHRFYQAAYVVTGPNGQPACGPIATNPYYLAADPTVKGQILATTSATECAPMNVFGEGSPSQASLDYIREHFNQRILTVQNVAAASITGSPFETWAGPVSFAVGGEARRDGGKQDADIFGINAANDGVNFTPLNGSQKVYEFFGETGIPLMKDSQFGQSLEFNGAVRQTHYSQSGWVTTWKVGGVYDPVDWFRVRATQSRDIRAPRNTELFQPGAANGLTITNPRNGVTASIPVLNGGNPNLKPEVGSTFTGGFVFTPKWGVLNGLRASVDYYHIKLKGAIGTVGGGEIINRYYNLGLQEYGQFIAFDNSPIGFNRVNVLFQNLNERLLDGADLELSYRVPMTEMGLPGRLDINLLASWVNRSQTIDEVAGKTTILNGVGYGIPRWRTNVSFNYALEKFSGTLQMRSFSGSIVNRALVGPDNPLYNPAAQNSVNDNLSPGLVYWNMSARYDVINREGRQLQLFFVVDNLLDKDPPITAVPMTSNGGIQYDFIGRNFRIGARLVM